MLSRLVALWIIGIAAVAQGEELSRIRLTPDRRGFEYEISGKPFTPIGFNYDHDEEGRLIEDYWDKEWEKIEQDFAEMRALGANVVRVHLQTPRFLTGPKQPHPPALERLKKLLDLAEAERLYLDLTGLGCYHKQDVPAWYDDLSEAERWEAQGTFWEAVARTCAESPAVFCYDLMNEPVVPGGKRSAGDWLGPPFGGKHFVQFITLSQEGRPRPEIAKAWIDTLVERVRRVDSRHLITVGLVDWSLDRPGLTSGFVPAQVSDKLDFLCVHLYPKAGELDQALEVLEGFARVGKPVVIEETFLLQCTLKEFEQFIDRSTPRAAGIIGFYWGKPRSEYQKGTTIGDALMDQWLGWFEGYAKKRLEIRP
ncbi:MAG: cellulase family glycosylhydrolase [Planctomycetales bacterium]